jgi:hypothetical protein
MGRKDVRMSAMDKRWNMEPGGWSVYISTYGLACARMEVRLIVQSRNWHSEW